MHASRARIFFNQTPVKSPKGKTRGMVAAVGQLILLPIPLKVQVRVPTAKAQEQTQVVLKKIALPFVYFRHFPQYCACECLDAHGQKLFVVRTTNLNFCPSLFLSNQIGYPISLRTIERNENRYFEIGGRKEGFKQEFCGTAP